PPPPRHHTTPPRVGVVFPGRPGIQARRPLPLSHGGPPSMSRLFASWLAPVALLAAFTPAFAEAPPPSPCRPAIECKLKKPISMNFTDAPLRQVLKDLRDATGLNLVIDYVAMRESGISDELPISVEVKDISLQSALKCVLRQAHLTYVVKDEVVQVTTEDH